MANSFPNLSHSSPTITSNPTFQRQSMSSTSQNKITNNNDQNKLHSNNSPSMQFGLPHQNIHHDHQQQQQPQYHQHPNNYTPDYTQNNNMHHMHNNLTSLNHSNNPNSSHPPPLTHENDVSDTNQSQSQSNDDNNSTPSQHNHNAQSNNNNTSNSNKNNKDQTQQSNNDNVTEAETNNISTHQPYLYNDLQHGSLQEDNMRSQQRPGLNIGPFSNPNNLFNTGPPQPPPPPNNPDTKTVPLHTLNTVNLNNPYQQILPSPFHPITQHPQHPQHPLPHAPPPQQPHHHHHPHNQQSHHQQQPNISYDFNPNSNQNDNSNTNSNQNMSNLNTPIFHLFKPQSNMNNLNTPIFGHGGYLPQDPYMRQHNYSEQTMVDVPHVNPMEINLDNQSVSSIINNNNNGNKGNKSLSNHGLIPLQLENDVLTSSISQQQLIQQHSQSQIPPIVNGHHDNNNNNNNKTHKKRKHRKHKKHKTQSSRKSNGRKKASNSNNNHHQSESTVQSVKGGINSGYRMILEEPVNKNMLSCHQCKNKKTLDRIIVCGHVYRINNTVKTCTKKYCKSCLLRFYLEAPPTDNKDPTWSSWKCPCCRYICCCAWCRKKKAKRLESVSNAIRAEAHRLTPAISLARKLVSESRVNYTKNNNSNNKIPPR